MSVRSLLLRCRSKSAWIAPIVAAACVITMAPDSQAAPLVGTVLLSPGATVFPNLTSAPAGVLLASLVAPFSFSTTAGVTSGTLTTAVFVNPSGTLDFYYQVANGAASATAIARETDASFAGFQTFVGYRTDAVGPFLAGTVAPVTADRNAPGSVIGFSFNPPDSAKILAGTTSDILVISTDAVNFATGQASVIDGGTQTLSAFQPASAVPEPTTAWLIGAGLVGLATLRRRMRS